MEKNIEAIVPHAFGKHEQCDISWCGYLQNPDEYKHSGLPGGFDLSGEDLQENLEKVFQKVAKKSDRLAHIGSSQGNESLNQLISTKVPKAKHFGGSESLNFRTAAGVAQKNIGRKYVTDVNRRHGLSPGKVTTSKNKSLDDKRKRKKETQKLPATKLKRKKMKLEGMEQTVRNETKEGETYCSGIAMGPDGDNPHRDQTEIPDPVRIVDLPPPVTSADYMVPVIVFDLETTGFGNNAEIVQLAAFYPEKDCSFEKFILPGQPIHPKAAEVTQMYSIGCKLFYKGQPMKTEPVKSVLTNFISWIPNNALLVAHNCKRFDSVILVSHLQNHSLMDSFANKIFGFSDTLPLFKHKYPNLQSYSQTHIATEILKTTYNAHNAKEDVTSLHNLIDTTIESTSDLLKYSFTVQSITEYIGQFEKKKLNMTTFNGIVREKILTKNMCEKAAASGLTLSHLKTAYERNGYDGIYAIFSEMVDGKPRVTKKKTIIEGLANYFCK